MRPQSVVRVPYGGTSSVRQLDILRRTELPSEATLSSEPVPVCEHRSGGRCVLSACCARRPAPTNLYDTLVGLSRPYNKPHAMNVGRDIIQQNKFLVTGDIYDLLDPHMKPKTSLGFNRKNVFRPASRSS